MFLRWRRGAPLACEEGATPESPSFSIDVLDFYTLTTTATIPMDSSCETRAEALVLSGYLGTVPLQPSLAVSLKTLELLRCLRLFKASFSIEAFAKLMCHYYSVSSSPDSVVTISLSSHALIPSIAAHHSLLPPPPLYASGTLSAYVS